MVSFNGPNYCSFFIALGSFEKIWDTGFLVGITVSYAWKLISSYTNIRYYVEYVKDPEKRENFENMMKRASKELNKILDPKD